MLKAKGGNCFVNLLVAYSFLLIAFHYIFVSLCLIKNKLRT